jgi:hypothetical protein
LCNRFAILSVQNDKFLTLENTQNIGKRIESVYFLNEILILMCRSNENITFCRALASHARGLASRARGLASHAQCLACRAQRLASHAQGIASHAQRLAFRAHAILYSMQGMK